MNTRVQVEHPVTEMVTNVDIVKTGIRVAAGEEIGIAQGDVRIDGWAIECRIYAEDPERDFRPSPGEILVYSPPGGPGVRTDSGVFAGFEVPVFYDPMVSKLICKGRDRAEAIARMERALQEFVVTGIKTSIPFHRKVMKNETFRSGHFDTSFIDVEILGKDAAPPANAQEERQVGVMLAAVAAYRRDRELAAGAQTVRDAQISRWKASGRTRQMRR